MSAAEGGSQDSASPPSNSSTVLIRINVHHVAWYWALLHPEETGTVWTNPPAHPTGLDCPTQPLWTEKGTGQVNERQTEKHCKKRWLQSAMRNETIAYECMRLQRQGGQAWLNNQEQVKAAMQKELANTD